MFAIIVFTLWFASEILLNRIFKSDDDDKKGYDKGSMRLIWVTIVLGNTLGILSEIFIGFARMHSFVLFYTGLSIILIGMIVRFTAIWQLGRFFTVDVTLRSEHKIIQSGLYRWLRHPSYAGMLISFFGFGLALNSWISLVLVTVPVSFAMIHRMNIEEDFLVAHFGESYTTYMKKTCRIIPYIY